MPFKLRIIQKTPTEMHLNFVRVLEHNMVLQM